MPHAATQRRHHRALHDIRVPSHWYTFSEAVIGWTGGTYLNSGKVFCLLLALNFISFANFKLWEQNENKNMCPDYIPKSQWNAINKQNINLTYQRINRILKRQNLLINKQRPLSLVLFHDLVSSCLWIESFQWIFRALRWKHICHHRIKSWWLTDKAYTYLV